MDKTIKFLDLLGLESIGIFFLGYVCFSVPFAELHIQLPFLDFPIFIGEILLFICLLAFVFKCCITPPKLNKWHYILIFYSIFVLGKALYGYAKWGPLALRDAALLYYPLFILFGYSFYRRDYFNNTRISGVFLLIMLVFVAGIFNTHWALGCFVLGLVCVIACSNKILKYAMLAALFLITPYQLFFYAARMMLVSNIITGLYYIIVFYFIMAFNRKIRLMFVVLEILFLSFGVLQWANVPRAKSIIGIKEMVNLFKEYDSRVKAKIDHYELKELSDVKVFNPEDEENNLYAYLRTAKPRESQVVEAAKYLMRKSKEQPRQEVVIITQEKQADLTVEKILKQSEEPLQQEEGIAQGIKSVSATKPEQGLAPNMAPTDEKGQKEQRVLYDIQTGYHNALFRIFIWRDMIRELAQKKPILGFDFGKPFRSVSLEILNWGTVDWQRDGWIAPHNSYLHILYRAGVIGVVFIFAIFFGLFRMVGRFIQLKSIIGVLLCGIIIDWFVAANFLLILELPYTAIPIWSLYGITLAYCYKKEASEYELAKQKSSGHRR